jgi:hypothetical protein
VDLDRDKVKGVGMEQGNVGPGASDGKDDGVVHYDGLVFWSSGQRDRLIFRTICLDVDLLYTYRIDTTLLI